MIGFAEAILRLDDDINPISHRIIWLIQEKDNGNQVVVGLIRSLDWLVIQGIDAVGCWTELHLHEMGAEGEFQVVAIEQCPEIESRRIIYDNTRRMAPRPHE